jgi:hypothetical protein
VIKVRVGGFGWGFIAAAVEEVGGGAAVGGVRWCGEAVVAPPQS